MKVNEQASWHVLTLAILARVLKLRPILLMLTAMPSKAFISVRAASL
jgi:hypothetical protein